MIRRADVTAEARSWMGTPWVHGQHLKGVGTDCGGYLGGVAVALGIVQSDWWETAFKRHAGYARQPTGNSLIEVLDEFMDRIDPAMAGEGDVVAVRFRRDPAHVGFLAPYHLGGFSLLHALYGGGVREVTEHRLDDKWRKRVTHAYALPGVL